jgi:hypothetical protein
MEERRTFWARVFARLFGGSHRWTRRDKVLEYIVHRVDAGTSLRDVVREEYVRRMTTGDEVDRILSDPRIVQTARERMRRDLEFEGSASAVRPKRERRERLKEGVG